MKIKHKNLLGLQFKINILNGSIRAIPIFLMHLSASGGNTGSKLLVSNAVKSRLILIEFQIDTNFQF